MVTSQKHPINFLAYWFTILLILILFGRFGIQVIGWLLMKLYEFLIQNMPLKI